MRNWENMGQSAAAKSLQSCPTLCNPIDGSPLGSSVPGILQARTLEWVAISFSQPLCEPVPSEIPRLSLQTFGSCQTANHKIKLSLFLQKHNKIIHSTTCLSEEPDSHCFTTLPSSFKVLSEILCSQKPDYFWNPNCKGVRGIQTLASQHQVNLQCMLQRSWNRVQ